MSTTLPAEPPIDLARVILKVQEEVGALARKSDGIQDLFSRLLTTSKLTASDVAAMQSIDYVAQHLDGLSTFLGHLAGQMPSEWTVQPGRATAAMTLSDLAGRVSFTKTTRDPVQLSDDTDFF